MDGGQGRAAVTAVQAEALACQRQVLQARCSRVAEIHQWPAVQGRNLQRAQRAQRQEMLYEAVHLPGVRLHLLLMQQSLQTLSISLRSQLIDSLCSTLYSVLQIQTLI